MSAHPLDRPVWSALTTRQAHLAIGDARAVRLAAPYGIFAASARALPEDLAALATLISSGSPLALVEIDDRFAVAGSIQSRASCHQMLLESLAPGEIGFGITRLTEADAPAMLELATLTRPGPFFSRTHELGDFVGVKENGRLVAMAGERMKPIGFTEVSGVCTHPHHRGRGYAGGLIRAVVDPILARGETPFLHTYSTNTRAIALYESLGFVLRRIVTMFVTTRG